MTPALKVEGDKVRSFGGIAMILLVDDEPSIVEIYSQLLVQQGYTVIPCSSATEAWEQFLKHQSQVQTVICDYFMPDMNGLELLAMLKTYAPNLQKIMITGYSVQNIPNDITVLQKPFSIRSLLQVLSERDCRRTCVPADILENAEIAMKPSKAVREYKTELSAVQEQNEQLTKIVGKMTVEK